MERVFSAPTEAEPDELYVVVSDLGTYPDWLGLVDQAEPTDPRVDHPNEVAWSITLRARIGPLARSKRLRMVRTVHDGRQVRFERRELDDRRHSPWTLSAVVDGDDTRPDGNQLGVDPSDDRGREGGPWRSRVSLDLRYGGSLWSGLLDGVLESAAEEATARLQAYVAATTA